MEWNDFSLWAALILFIEIFCHFLRQRTLRDKNSRIFTEIIVLGILHCFFWHMSYPCADVSIRYRGPVHSWNCFSALFGKYGASF